MTNVMNPKTREQIEHRAVLSQGCRFSMHRENMKDRNGHSHALASDVRSNLKQGVTSDAKHLTFQ